MEEVNEALYESKLIGYPNPFKDKVVHFVKTRGVVSQENYDNDLAVVTVIVIRIENPQYQLIYTMQP